MRHMLMTATILLLATGIRAQQNTVPTTSTTITAVASGDLLRITAPAPVLQMRVEVYGGNGAKVWDSEIRGNVFDWHMQDGQAQRLPAGDYACVVTVKNIAGRMTQKLGSVTVGEKNAAVHPLEAAQLTQQQSVTIGPIEDKSAWTVPDINENPTTTVIANDGTDAQITRGRGSLTFRFGNFFSGSDQEQMRLTEDGNLGIGTSKPRFKLDVAGAVSAREGLVFNNGSLLNVNEKGTLTLTDSNGTVVANATGSGTQNKLAKWTDNSGTLGDSAVTEISGQVGIGVANPGDFLDIGGPPNASGRTGIHVTTTSGAGNATLYFENNRGNFSAYGGLLTGGSTNSFQFFGVPRADRTFLIADGPNSLGLGVGTLVSQPLLFGTSNTERMRISPGGQVGIGDDFPEYKLSVLDPGNKGLLVHTNSGGGTVASFGANGVFQIDKGAGPNSAGGRFTVLENGKVGIGNGSPTFQLHVVDQSNTGLRVQTNTIGGTVASFGGNGAFQIDAPGVSGGRLMVSENGNVGIGTGTNAPEQKLQVTGDILSTGAQAGFTFRDPDVGFDWRWHASINNGQSVARLSLNGVGDVIKVRAIDFYTELNGLILDTVNIGGGQQSICRDSNFAIGDCSSSLRYKTNIAPFISGLSLIRQLRPILFDWKKDGMHDVGFGAEDVAKINPLFVTYNNQGQVEGVKYDRFSTVFVNAFNEQQMQIEQQQKQIDALKKLVCADRPKAKVCSSKN